MKQGPGPPSRAFVCSMPFYRRRPFRYADPAGVRRVIWTLPEVGRPQAMSEYEQHWTMSGPPGEGGRGNDGGSEGPNTGVVVKARPRTRKPAMYKVLMLNDDYTPMEFVVHVLERFFQKSREEATRIMLHVHRRGVGVCGVFTYEVAETKETQVMDLARQNQHPLQCTIEKE